MLIIYYGVNCVLNNPILFETFRMYINTVIILVKVCSEAYRCQNYTLAHMYEEFYPGPQDRVRKDRL